MAWELMAELLLGAVLFGAGATKLVGDPKAHSRTLLHELWLKSPQQIRTRLSFHATLVAVGCVELLSGGVALGGEALPALELAPAIVFGSAAVIATWGLRLNFDIQCGCVGSGQKLSPRTVILSTGLCICAVTDLFLAHIQPAGSLPYVLLVAGEASLVALFAAGEQMPGHALAAVLYLERRRKLLRLIALSVPWNRVADCSVLGCCDWELEDHWREGRSVLAEYRMVAADSVSTSSSRVTIVASLPIRNYKNKNIEGVVLKETAAAIVASRFVSSVVKKDPRNGLREAR